MLGVSSKTVVRWLRDGRLTGSWLSPRTARVSLSSITALISGARPLGIGDVARTIAGQPAGRHPPTIEDPDDGATEHSRALRRIVCEHEAAIERCVAASGATDPQLYGLIVDGTASTGSRIGMRVRALVSGAPPDIFRLTTLIYAETGEHVALHAFDADPDGEMRTLPSVYVPLSEACARWRRQLGLSELCPAPPFLGPSAEWIAEHQER